MTEKRFINPYNFIKFPSKKANKYEDTDKHTGVIEYTLTTKTPLFIPNSSNDNAFDTKVKDHKSYDFYSYTNLENKNAINKYYEPVIPGSEIRGLIRNNYETLTDSCMSLLNDVHPVKRVGARFSPGLLIIEEDNTLSLYAADSFRIDKNCCYQIINGKKEEIKDGQEVFFNIPSKAFKNGRKYYKMISEYSFDKNKEFDYDATGYLIRWGFGVKKKNYHVFCTSENGEIKKENLNFSEIKRMVNDVINSYLEQPAIKPDNETAYKEYRDAFNNFIDQKKGTDYVFPINYTLIENNLYLTPATFSKEVSKNSIGDLTIFKPCQKDICPACDLFGKVNDNAKGSLIRFSDLKVSDKLYDKENYYLCNQITLNNLNSPKLGNVDFYLERPENADYWSYDYLVRNEMLELKDGVLRGRKYYWHHVYVDLNKNVEKSNLNKTIRPLKENISFKGKLYFDGISKKQLDQLIYILNIGKDNMGYKLGMGKPLGLGSVSIKVDEVKERIISLENDELSYREENYDYSNVTYDSCGLSKEVKEEFEKISRFDAVPTDVPICYPKTTAEVDHGYEWFIANHSRNGETKMPDKRKDMFISESLPHILDKDISMPCLDNAIPKSNGEGSKIGQKKDNKPYHDHDKQNNYHGYKKH